MMTRSARCVLVLAGVCLAGVCAMALPSCTAQPVVRHLSADSTSLAEAGRAMGVAELTANLATRYHGTDPERWMELATRAGQLSQSAGHLILSRARAVAGSRTEAEQFYAQLDSDLEALRLQREQLAADLSAALPGT